MGNRRAFASAIHLVFGRSRAPQVPSIGQLAATSELKAQWSWKTASERGCPVCWLLVLSTPTGASRMQNWSCSSTGTVPLHAEDPETVQDGQLLIAGARGNTTDVRYMLRWQWGITVCASSTSMCGGFRRRPCKSPEPFGLLLGQPDHRRLLCCCAT